MRGISYVRNYTHFFLAAIPTPHFCPSLDHTQNAWASVTCGVFLCMRCAGIHRGLGVHVSQVRSHLISADGAGVQRGQRMHLHALPSKPARLIQFPFPAT